MFVASRNSNAMLKTISILDSNFDLYLVNLLETAAGGGTDYPPPLPQILYLTRVWGGSGTPKSGQVVKWK